MGLLVILSAGAYASIQTYGPYSPAPPDLWDLDHYYWYKWGLNWSIPVGEEIIEATLKINNIYDTSHESSDKLRIHLLDNPPVGVISQWDGGNISGDRFKGNPLIGSFTDYSNYDDTPENLEYNFSTLGLIDELTAYAANGVFGFGFDPDCYYCHYKNSEISFTITTEKAPVENPVPEPSGLLALAGGLTSIVGLAIRRRK